MRILLRKQLFWWILSIVGFNFLTMCYILAWQGKIFYSLFWLGLGISCFSLLVIMFLSQNKKYILFVLFILGLVIYNIQIYRSPDYFVNRDEMMHYQGYISILEKGNLNYKHTTFPIVKDYPGLELIITEIASITGLKPIIAGKMLIGFVHSMVLLIIWFYFYQLSLSNNMATMGSFLYAINPRYSAFDTMVSYESLGILFVIILLLLIGKMIRNKRLSLSLLAIIVLFATIITHHFSSYLFLSYGIILVILFRLYERYYCNSDKNNVNTFIILACVLVFGWLIYVAVEAIDYLFIGFKDRILAILQFSAFGGQGGRTLFEGNPVPGWESFILHFIYPPVLFLLCLAGGYLLRRKPYNILWASLFVYGPLLFLMSWLLVPTSGAELAYRSWAFLFIGVSFFIALIYNDIWKKNHHFLKTLSLFMLVVLFIGGISLARNEGDRFPNGKFVFITSFYNKGDFNAADWLYLHAGKYKSLAGIEATRDVFGSFGRQNVDVKAGEELITTSLEKLIKNPYWLKTNFLVLDYRTTYLKFSLPLSYFGKYSPEIYTRQYGFNKLLPISCLAKFDGFYEATPIYTNGVLKIYGNKNYL